MKVDKSLWPRIPLKTLLKEYSVRNKSLELANVYSVTNSQGFVPASVYFENTVQSSNLSTYKIVKEGMFAYNPSRINVGSIAIQDAEDQVIVSPLYVIFSLVEDLNPHFLLRYLKSDIGISQIRSKTSGSVRASLRFKDLGCITIPVPTLVEQRAIASELDALQTVINGYREQIEDLDALAKSIFIDSFGDPITNPKGWDVKPIDEFGKITTGNTPSRANHDFYGSNYLEWIKTDNIVNDRLYPTTAVEYLSSEGAKKGRIVKSNAILVCCIAGSLQSIGRCCLTDRSVAFNQQINAIECDETHNPLFTYWLIKLAHQLFMDAASTGMKHILSKSDMSGITLPNPSIELQKKFADKVIFIEQQKELLRQQLADAEMLMAERMQYYFS